MWIHIYSTRSLRSCICTCWSWSCRCISKRLAMYSASCLGRHTWTPGFSKSCVPDCLFTLILDNNVVQDYATCHELPKCLRFPNNCNSMNNTPTGLEYSEWPLHTLPSTFLRLCKETLFITMRIWYRLHKSRPLRIPCCSCSHWRCNCTAEVPHHKASWTKEIIGAHWRHC